MYSNEELEKLWFLYKLEGQSQNLSIESFCKQQGVSYRVFYKWFRDRKKTVVPVNVMGMDEGEKREEILETPEGPSAKSLQVSAPIQSVSLILESGVQITKNNLSYRELEDLIGKLEVLC